MIVPPWEEQRVNIHSSTERLFHHVLLKTDRERHKVKLGFADIIISFIPTDGVSNFKVGSEYAPFLCQGNPDITFRVHRDQFPFSEPGEILFNSGCNWYLYRKDRNSVVLLYFRIGERLPFRSAILKPDFSSGDIYVDKEINDTLLPYPLPNPLDAVLVTHLLSRGRGVLCHACGVVDHERGILFFGQSGAGKSTLAALWSGQPGVTLLSDDRVIVRKREGRFWIHGTPWYGSVRAASPKTVPLEHVFIIRHASANQVAFLKASEVVSCILVRSFPTFWDAEGMSFSIDFLGQLSQSVPCYELGFVPDRSVIDFVRCITS